MPVRQPSPHGTANRYGNNGCRCAACSAAMTAYNKAARDARMKQRFEVEGVLVSYAENVRHGTVTGYRGYGCRCDACREAGSRRKGKRLSNA